MHIAYGVVHKLSGYIYNNTMDIIMNFYFIKCVVDDKIYVFLLSLVF